MRNFPVFAQEKNSLQNLYSKRYLHLFMHTNSLAVIHMKTKFFNWNKKTARIGTRVGHSMHSQRLSSSLSNEMKHVEVFGKLLNKQKVFFVFVNYEEENKVEHGDQIYPPWHTGVFQEMVLGSAHFERKTFLSFFFWDRRIAKIPEFSIASNDTPPNSNVDQSGTDENIGHIPQAFKIRSFIPQRLKKLVTTTDLDHSEGAYISVNDKVKLLDCSSFLAFIASARKRK